MFGSCPTGATRIGRRKSIRATLRIGIVLSQRLKRDTKTGRQVGCPSQSAWETDAEITKPSRQHLRVIELVAQGLKNCEIADQLGVRQSPVRNCLSQTYDKAGLNHHVELDLGVHGCTKTRRSCESPRSGQRRQGLIFFTFHRPRKKVARAPNLAFYLRAGPLALHEWQSTARRFGGTD